jgi:hypothetical protein
MSSKTCVIMTDTETSILDILIHVFILTSILSIFFIVVIVPIEKNELNNEVNKNIEDGVKHIIDEMKSTKDTNKSSLQFLIKLATGEDVSVDKASNEFVQRLKSYYSGENEVNETYNKGLVLNLITVIGFLLISIIAIYFIFKSSCGKCPKIFTLIGENLLLFTIIGIIEYIFFIKFASKYIPIKPSLIIKTVNESL